MARHLRAIDEEIRRLVCRDVPERVLVVRMPPRHGKSELCSHWAPCWHLANWPDRNVLLASYEANFAGSWGRKARDSFVDVTLSNRVVEARIAPDRQSVRDWGTTDGGYMATTGVGGPITGKGFHLGVCDDLIKNAEQAQSESYRDKCWEWFTSTLWTRREPEGVLIVIGTPWHRDDYLARLRDWEEPIRELSLPAIARHGDALGRAEGEALWPERFPVDELRAIERAQGPYYWHALYQGEPRQHEQAEWPGEYFDDIWVDRMPPAFELSALACDPSKGRDKGDYSANVFAGYTGGTVYVDATVERRPGPQIISDLLDMAERYRPEEVGIEAVAFQELFVPEFERVARTRGVTPWVATPLEDPAPKIIRIRRLGGWLAQGLIKFVRSPGCRLLVEQLKDFPLADHDDGPDGLEMAIRMLNTMASATPDHWVEEVGA